MLDSLIAWLSPGQRKAIYAALGAVASILAALGYANQATLDGWVALAGSVLALLALCVAAIKAKSVDWKALYVVAAATVATIKGVGLIDDQLEAQTNKVLGLAIAAVPLIIAAVRTDTSVATGQPAQELANDLAQQQIASPPLPAPVAPAVDPEAYEGQHESNGGHNHITRDIKRPGECPACDIYLATHPTTRPARGDVSS